MKIGGLVKCRRTNKVGVIMGHIKTYLYDGVMCDVFIDGKMYALHETDLEVINESR